MKKLIHLLLGRVWLIILCLYTPFFPTMLHGQLLVNGALFHSLPNSIIYVQTDSFILDNNAFVNHEGLLVIDKDLIVNSGSLEVDGTIDIEEDLINNDEIIGISNNSFILLNGDWINNSLFVPGLNTTILDGSTQNITGSQASTFYNLENLGALADVKRLVGVNAIILNQLNLGNVEFATDGNDLSVYNSNINAILRNEGFVSSLGDGRLERATNAVAAYLFPTGSTAGVLRYRPIELTPESATVDTFGVRLANTNATNEGYDILLLSDSLCAVNPNFYHRIYGNAAATIDMFYIPSEDGTWDAMAQWQGTSIWDKLPDEMPSTSGQFSVISIPNWSNYSQPAFALGIQQPALQVLDTVEINLGDEALLDATYSGPNPQSIVWYPLADINCPNCLNTEAQPLITTTYNLEISVTQNCILRDSTIVIVNQPGLFLPTGFSPNGDGVNDVFRPLNENLEVYELFIYNRWGELIFTTTDVDFGWDGQYKGVNQEIGVYSYSAEYQFIGQDKKETSKGNVTLIR